MNKPNIILISIDTLRADHVSCYGYKRHTTPCLDQIAEEGVLFEKSYTTAAWTPPGHGSMLTGLYPSQHGAMGKNKIRKAVPTLAEKLMNNGYITAGFVNNSQVGELVGLNRGHQTFNELWKGIASKTIIDRGMRYVYRKAIKTLHRSDKGAGKTIRHVKSWLKDNVHCDVPFYLFIHFIEPHNPLNPPNPFRSKFLKEVSRNGYNKNIVKLVANNPLICLSDDIKPSPVDMNLIRALYDAEIAYTDYKIKELMNYLKELKVYDNTLIIITSDHGEHFGEHGLYSHVASLYEPVLHVPLIMRYPNVFKRGIRDIHIVQTIDIFPTVMEIIQINDDNFKSNSIGRSLVNAGSTVPYHDYIIAEWEGRIPEFVEDRIGKKDENIDWDRFTKKLTMIREDNYKYILGSNGSEELYDLASDRAEIKNLVLERKDVVEDLRQKLCVWEKNMKSTKIEEEEQSLMDEQVIKNLKVLGYM